MIKMRLGEWLKEYRRIHKMTMKEMANACGFSKSYVNLLEKGINPTTQKPVSPTMQTVKKIAEATGQDVDSFVKILDDEQPVTISPTIIKVNEEEIRLLKGYRKLSDESKELVMRMIGQLNFVAAI
ncbi:MAG: helix-turn-helix transcriptional regulator [Selenomonadaceae bacterium]|nr:helix-turn-helix transcriptional regulator [Selenomonadaceae bacterium]